MAFPSVNRGHARLAMHRYAAARARRGCCAHRRRLRGFSTASSASPLLIVGVDSGTQSTKACVFDAAGALVSEASAPQTIASPVDGYAEQDIAEWRSGVFAAIRDAVDAVSAAQRAPVAAIGLSFQRESFTLIDTPVDDDAPLVPLRPAILWLDGRADGEVAAMRSGSAEPALSADLYHQATGKPLDVTSACARMRWLAEHEPELLRAPFQWVDCGAVLSHALTGELTTCIAGADTCGLVDLHHRRWSEEILAVAGLTVSQMPALAEPGALLGGGVTAAAAAELQGAVQEGCPVVMAGWVAFTSSYFRKLAPLPSCLACN